MKKIKYLLSLSLLTIFIVGCENNEPEDVISEDAKPRVSYTINTTAATEVDATEIVVDITMDKPIKTTTRFTVDQIGGSAVLHEDYEFADAVIPAYQTQAQLVISITKDLDLTEGDEDLLVNIGATNIPDTYEVIGKATFDIDIEDFVYCSWTLDATDAYGDGWNGGFITVMADGISTDYAASDDDGAVNQSETTSYEFAIGDGSAFSITYTSGGGTGAGPGWESENSYVLTSPTGTTYTGGPIPTEGEIIGGVNACN